MAKNPCVGAAVGDMEGRGVAAPPVSGLQLGRHTGGGTRVRPSKHVQFWFLMNEIILLIVIKSIHYNDYNK